jgi:hypothetical protein
VVVASHNDGALLMRCVEALAAQADPSEVEILVARDVERFGDVDRASMTGRSPGMRWIEASRGSTVPRLRGLGIAAARADLIALLEDDCVVDAGWCRAAVTAAGPDAAVGGAVEPGPYRRSIDWAVYFCEYGRFMLPVRDAPNAPLPGNNVVYSRREVAALSQGTRDEFREVFVHAAWRLAGVPTRVSGALVVRNVNSWALRHVTSVPFHHGRAYAAQRFGGRSATGRAAIALLALALPAVKVLRIVVDTLSRRRLAGRLVRALPWILVFTVSWSLGESVGCVSGPGSSPSRWR